MSGCTRAGRPAGRAEQFRRLVEAARGPAEVASKAGVRLAELKRTGYEGWLSIEYERRWYPDLLPPAKIGMQASAETLRRILHGLS